MNFIEACKHAQQWKGICYPSLDGYYKLNSRNGSWAFHSGNSIALNVVIPITEILCDDWMLYEEEKKEKVYILQKDLPDSKVGDRYILSKDGEIYYRDGDEHESWWTVDVVTQTPEFFLPEKQKPEPIKVYRITSFRHIDNGSIWKWHEKDSENYPFYSERADSGGYSLEGMLQMKEVFEIYSVKRLSDNLEFTVGDEVYYDTHPERTWVIHEFFIRDDGRLIARNKNHDWVEYVNISLKKKSEKKEVKEESPMDKAWNEYLGGCTFSSNERRFFVVAWKAAEIHFTKQKLNLTDGVDYTKENPDFKIRSNSHHP